MASPQQPTNQLVQIAQRIIKKEPIDQIVASLLLFRKTFPELGMTQFPIPLYVYYSIYHNIYTPLQWYVTLLPHIQSYQECYLLSFCFRILTKRLNPNEYIKDPVTHDFYHIAFYTMTHLKNFELSRFIVLSLFHLGADLTMDLSKTIKQSVQSTMRHNILHTQTDKDIKRMCFFFHLHHLYPVQRNEIEFCFMYWNESLFLSQYLPTHIENGMYKLHNLLAQTAHLTLFEHTIKEMGLLPTYPFMIELGILCNHFKGMGDDIMVWFYKEMIRISIHYGVKLDQYQFTFIAKGLTDTMITDITTEHAKPFFEKQCHSYNTPVTRGFLALSESMGINTYQSKEDFCKQISLLQQHSDDELKSYILKQQNLRLESVLNDVIELLKPADEKQTLDTVCAAPDAHQKTYRDYGDHVTVVYKDQEGTISCFTPSHILSIMETKVNPFTNQPVEEYVYQKISTMYYRWTSLGITVDHLLTINDSIGLLRKNDEIENTDTISLIDRWLEAWKPYSISYNQIKLMGKRMYSYLLQKRGISFRWKEIPDDLACALFFRLLGNDINDPERIEQIAKEIQYCFEKEVFT